MQSMILIISCKYQYQSSHKDFFSIQKYFCVAHYFSSYALHLAAAYPSYNATKRLLELGALIEVTNIYGGWDSNRKGIIYT